MSSFDSETKSVFSSAVKIIAVGCKVGAIGGAPDGPIHRASFPLVKSSSATCDAFHKLHHARRPSLVATHVYGYAAGTRSFVLRSKVCSVLPVDESIRITLSD